MRRACQPMVRPRVLVLSAPGADSFEWVSDGWFSQSHLMARAAEAIEQGDTVPQVCERLEVAGFEVVRQPGPELTMFCQLMNS